MNKRKIMKHHATVEQVRELKDLGILFSKDEISEVYCWDSRENWNDSGEIFHTLDIDEIHWTDDMYWKDPEMLSIPDYILPKPDLLSLINKLPRWIEQPEDMYGINFTHSYVRYISNHDRILVIGDRKDYSNHASFGGNVDLIDATIEMLKFLKRNGIEC